MTPQEAGALLAVCAGFDNRKPDADQAKAWAAALTGLRFFDCRDAIVTYYGTRSRDFIYPVDVRRLVTELRAKRINAVQFPEPPLDLDPDDTAALIRWQVETRNAIADGTYVDPPKPALVRRRITQLAGRSMDDA